VRALLFRLRRLLFRLVISTERSAAPFSGAAPARIETTINVRTVLKKTALLTLSLVIAGCPAMARPYRAYQNSYTSERPTHISCAMIRAYVSQVGLVQAKAMARAAGMTASQERRARQCVLNKD